MTATAVTPRSLLGIDDLTADELHALLDLAAVMKRHPLAWRGSLEGRAVACVFEHASMRTQVSLEVAAHRLGALPVVVGPHSDAIADAARSLSSYCDAIAVRTRRHRDLLEGAEHATVPVINALTDREHPCRALADCLALRERFGGLDGLEIAYVGAREAGMHSLIEAAALTGMTVRVSAPDDALPDPALLARAGAAVRLCATPLEATRGAAMVYTSGEPRPVEVAMNLLPVEQAVLRVLVTGDWSAEMTAIDVLAPVEVFAVWPRAQLELDVYAREAPPAPDVLRTTGFLTPAHAERVAAWFTGSDTTPDADTRRAYRALARETGHVFAVARHCLGVRVRYADEEPYESAAELCAELREHGTMTLLREEPHPLLGRDAFDQLRVVHDVFGHAALGLGFDLQSEYATWLQCRTLFSAEARPAAFCELVGAVTAYVGTGVKPGLRAKLPPVALL